MLKLQNINMHFGNNHILKNISCKIQKGDFISIVGTNGTGKSTLFDIISGKLKPTSGSIFFEDKNITDLSELKRAHFITRIFQNTHLNCIDHFTVIQNLSVALYSRRSARFIDSMKNMSETKAKEIIKKIGMSETILNTPMHKLSGGQRQLIAFTMATLLIPKLLLLDEPTAALDPQAATTLLVHANHFIKQHSITSLLITHDPYIALNLGNKIWVLENGTLSKEYNQEEKKFLNPEKLIGQIDYEKL